MRVRTVRSGVSRGTETLGFRGVVLASQYATMRARVEQGDFPGPVKYGYLNVGVVDRGLAALRGRTGSSASTRTETAYVVPAAAVAVVPEAVPERPGQCWPVRWRRPSTPSGTPGRWSATGSPSSGPG